MLIEIVDFEVEHLHNMDMRRYESQFKEEYEVLKEMSLECSTAIVDGNIVCCWGIFEDGYFWQIPSMHVKDMCFVYSRRALKIIKDMVKSHKSVYTICRFDELHDRWMKFIGFEAKGSPMEGYLKYEVRHGN